MRILAMSDLHGHHEVYRAIPDLVRRHAVEAVILAGDLLGVPEGYETIEAGQRADAEAIVGILAGLPAPVHNCFGSQGRHYNVAGGGRLRGFVIDLATLQHERVDPDDASA